MADEQRRLGSATATLAKPRTRSECERGPRPCPWVSCRFHLLELRESNNGRLELGTMALPAGADNQLADAFTEHVANAVVEMHETCALDVVDREDQGATPEQVGIALRITRQRVNQLERGLVPRVRLRMVAKGIR